MDKLKECIKEALEEYFAERERERAEAKDEDSWETSVTRKSVNMEERITRPNINRTGYTAPLSRAGIFKIKSSRLFTDAYGDMVNKLGLYEDLGSPDEVRRLVDVGKRRLEQIRAWENEKK